MNAKYSKSNLKGKHKRIISLLLAATMFFGLLPAGILFADQQLEADGGLFVLGEAGGGILAPGDMYIVRFIVEGEALYSTYVAEGALALYPGAPPANLFPDGAVSFLGWYEQASPDSAPYDFQKPIASSLDLFARFSDMYLIQFYDGYGKVYYSKRLAQGAYAAPPEQALMDVMPVPQDKFFDFWTISESEPYAPYIFGAAPVSSDMEFHAALIDKLYIYYITYSSEMKPNMLRPGDVAPKPAVVPERLNYEFKYWTTTPGGDGPEYNFTSPVYADLILYAHWAAKPNSVSYKVIWWLEAPDLAFEPTPGNAAHYEFAYSEIITGATPGEPITINSLPGYLTDGTPVNSSDPLLYADFQYSAPAIVSGAGNTVISVYLTRRIYRITFDLGSDDQWLQFYANNNRYYGNNYYIDVKYEQDLTNIWPCTMTAAFNEKATDGPGLLPFNCWSVPDSVNTTLDIDEVQWLTRRNIMSYDMMPKNPAAVGYTLDAVYLKTDLYSVRYWIEPYDGQGAGQPLPNTRIFNGKVYFLDDQYSQNNVPDLEPKAINGLFNAGQDFSDSETGPGDPSRGLFQNFYYDRNKNDLVYEMGGAPVSIQIPTVPNVMYGQPLSLYYAYPAAWPNHKFIGWYKDPDHTLEFDFEIAKMSANTNLAVFAKWESQDHIVSFKDGDETLGTQGVADGEPVNGNSLSFSGIVYELGLFVPGKGNFLGWRYYPAGVDVLTPYPIDLLVYSDLELYALWQVDGFKVIYNMGDANPLNSMLPADNRTYSIGTVARALRGNMFAPYAGLAFVGWRVNGVGPSIYYPDSLIPISGNMQMYPYFSAGGDITTIMFHNNYPANQEQFARTVIRNSDIPLPDYAIFNATPPDTTFVGWQTSPGGGEFYSASSAYRVGDVQANLYAVWSSNNVKLVFDSNHGGAPILTTFYVSRNSIVDILSIAPKLLYKDGHSLAGWTWERNAAATRITSSAMISTDTTVYGLWLARSDTPNINPINEGDRIVKGEGVPGADIIVTWPDGKSSTNAIVDAHGDWAAEVPAGISLFVNNIVAAIQHEPGKEESVAARATVGGGYRPGDGKSDTPNIDVIVEADRTVSGYGVPGSEITVIFKNLESKKAIVAPSGIWAVDVPEGVDLVVGDLVFAYQATGFKAESEWAQSTVIAHRDASEQPIVNPITEGDLVVGGKGKPGAKIVVTWPGAAGGTGGTGGTGGSNGSTSTGIVDGSGNWYIIVPDGATLIAGAKVGVAQTEVGKSPSEPVNANVQAKGPQPTTQPPGGTGSGGTGTNNAGGAQAPGAGSGAGAGTGAGAGAGPGAESAGSSTSSELSQQIPSTTTNIDDENAPLVGFISDHILYVRGYPDGSVMPDAPITRAETAAIIYRLLEASTDTHTLVSTFPDVMLSDWFGESVSYLASIGIVKGYLDGSFRPNNPITRAEFATMISGFDNLVAVDYNIFPDVAGHWAVSFINSAAEKGWVTGYPGGEFMPEENITRAEVVTVINRMLNRKLLAADIPSWAPSYTDLTELHWAYADIVEASTGHNYERKQDGYELWTELLK